MLLDHNKDTTLFRRADFRVYYYQGNFYQPLSPPSQHIGKIRRAIRLFYFKYQKSIEAYREKSSYKTLLELFDEQEKTFSRR